MEPECDLARNHDFGYTSLMSPNQKQPSDTKGGTPGAGDDAAAAPKNMAKPGTNEWRYDEVMRWIEPDLMSTVLPTHPEKYKDETREETVARMTHYDQAFAIFDSVVKELSEEDRDIARKIAHEAQKSAHATEQKERDAEVKKAEQTFDD